MRAGAARLLAVFGDSPAGAALLELPIVLAHALHRDMELVYVEDAPALSAAALPGMQVLAHAGAQWTPLVSHDVERGYRAQAGRLRSLCHRITLRESVNWSMRTLRGALPQTVLELRAESDLLFVGVLPPTRVAWSAARAGRSPVRLVATLCDAARCDERCLHVAGQLAQVLRAGLRIERLAGGGFDARAVQRAAADADVLVLPAKAMAPTLLARMACPVLLVG